MVVVAAPPAEPPADVLLNPRVELMVITDRFDPGVIKLTGCQIKTSPTCVRVPPVTERS